MREALHDLTADPDYQSFTDEEKADAVRDIVRDVRRARREQ